MFILILDLSCFEHKYHIIKHFEPFMKGKEFKPTKLSLISLLLASMLMLMGGAAVAPALPSISIAFPNASESLINLIITLPSLAIALTGLIIGALSDKVGKVKVLLFSLLLFAVAGITGYFLNDIYAILVGRFFVGIGIAGITSCCTALIAEYYTGMTRVKVLSYQSAAMGIGVLLLETTGGALAGISWRDPFLIYALGFFIFALALVSLKEPQRPEREMTEEIKSEETFNLKLVFACYATIFLTMIIFFALPSKLPYYLAEINAPSIMAGIFLGIQGICNALTSLSFRRISSAIERFRLLAIAFFLMGVGFALLYLPHSYVSITIAMIFTGVGVGLISPTVSTTLASQSVAKTSGKIMGGYSTALNLGQFAATLALVPILAYVGDYGGLFLVIGIIALLVGVVYTVVSLFTSKAHAKKKEASA